MIRQRTRLPPWRTIGPTSTSPCQRSLGSAASKLRKGPSGARMRRRTDPRLRRCRSRVDLAIRAFQSGLSTSRSRINWGTVRRASSSRSSRARSSPPSGRERTAPRSERCSSRRPGMPSRRACWHQRRSVRRESRTVPRRGWGTGSRVSSRRYFVFSELLSRGSRRGATSWKRQEASRTRGSMRGRLRFKLGLTSRVGCPSLLRSRVARRHEKSAGTGERECQAGVHSEPAPRTRPAGGIRRRMQRLLGGCPDSVVGAVEIRPEQGTTKPSLGIPPGSDRPQEAAERGRLGGHSRRSSPQPEGNEGERSWRCTESGRRCGSRRTRHRSICRVLQAKGRAVPGRG